MDRELIAEKLESLRRCVVRIRTKCPATSSALAADADAQDIVVLNLQRAVQLCVDIGAHIVAESDAPTPTTMGDTFDALGYIGVMPTELVTGMRRAVGLRNIAVHNYSAIDWAIVHAACQTRLDDFRRFAEAIGACLERS